MKFSHVAAALAGGFGTLCAASASASPVEVYGALDTALSWQHRDYVAQTSSSTLRMNSGQWIGSRVGIRGVETLENGLKVGFVLENGFSTDAGTLGQGGRLFGREARVYLDGDFGFLSAGRMGSLVGGNGPYARFGHVVSPFSCGWGDIGGHLQVVSLGYEFVDNAVAYKTPTVNGFDATVQYSFGTDANAYGSGIEGTSGVDRLLSGALRYQGHGLLVAFGVESINWANPAADENRLDDAFSTPAGRSSTSTARSSRTTGTRRRRRPSASPRASTAGASTSASMRRSSVARHASAWASATSRAAARSSSR